MKKLVLTLLLVACTSTESQVTLVPDEPSTEVSMPEPEPEAPEVSREECELTLKEFRTQPTPDKFILASKMDDHMFQRCAQFFTEEERQRYRALQQVNCAAYAEEFGHRSPAPFVAAKDIIRSEITSDYRKYQKCKSSIPVPIRKFVNFAALMLEAARNKCVDLGLSFCHDDDELIEAAQYEWDEILTAEERKAYLDKAMNLEIPEV